MSCHVMSCSFFLPSSLLSLCLSPFLLFVAVTYRVLFGVLQSRFAISRSLGQVLEANGCPLLLTEKDFARPPALGTKTKVRIISH